MGRHSSGNYTKKSKSKIIIALTIIIIAVIGVSIYLYTTNMEKKGPEITINNMFNALKQSDESQVNEYLDYNKLLSSLDEMLVKEDARNEEVEKKLFESIEWKIENIEADGETATAVVELTNKDFIEVVTAWMKKIVNVKNNGIELTDEVSLQKLQETLEETDTTKTVIKRISLEKVDEKWKVTVNEELTNLVFPGVDSVVSVLNKT